MESQYASGWIDEPCKREDFLWKSSTGGKFRNINCATINHLVNYFVAPTGEFQQMLVTFKDEGIEIPPTIIRVTFTRYSSHQQRLVYTLNINPEMFGVARDATTPWGSNSWHKAYIERDPKKEAFISKLTKWTQTVQSRMDTAFDKRGHAFIGLESLEDALR